MSTVATRPSLYRLQRGRVSGAQPPQGAPLAAAMLLAIGLWLGFGVGPKDIVLFFLYEAAFLLVPGVLLYRAVSGERHSVLRELSIGWALGHIVEVLAFGLTAWLGIRGWFSLYPALIIGGSLLALRQLDVRSAAANRSGVSLLPSRRLAWAVGAVFAVALAYLAIEYFAQTPLPTRSGFGGYIPDVMFHLDLASQLLHGWPLTSPEVAGVPLPYELFVSMHLASIAQVTGVQVSVVLLRLYLVPLLGLFLIQLCWAGRRLTGTVWSGPVAGALILLVGEINPFPRDYLGAGIQPLLAMGYSPTFALGLTMFLPALVLAAEAAHLIPGDEPGRRGLLVLTLLLLGCAGAKGAILPVLGGSFAIYVLWRWARDRRLDTAAIRVCVLVLAVLGATYVILYRGQNEGLHLLAGGTASGIPRISHLANVPRNIPVLSDVSWFSGNVVATLLIAAAPLAGLIFVLRRRSELVKASSVLLLGACLVGLFFFFFFFAPGYSQLWFTEYGYVAATILAASGLTLFYNSWRPDERIGRTILVGGASWALVGLLVTYLAHATDLSRVLDYVLWVCVPVALAITWFAAGRSGGRRVALLAMLPVIGYGALNAPVRLFPELLEHGHDPPWANNWGRAGPELVAALSWIRTHTSQNSVLAVNNYYVDWQGRREPYDMFYSALSQRAVYLEGWNETVQVKGTSVEATLRSRRAINDAVFLRGDPRALSEMVSQANVKYILVDSTAPYSAKAIPRLGTLRYSNRQAAVYQIKS